MNSLTDNVWKIIEKECEYYSQADERFIFHKAKQNEFNNLFSGKYLEIKTKFMDSSVKELDRHKVAAIIVYSLLDANVIRYKDLDDDLLFIGDYLVALKTALSYLLDSVNAKLKEKDVKKVIDCFELPEAQACNTDYLSIMCRNLYYTKGRDITVILELAEKFFLLEYILLQKNNIEPSLLKEY